MTTRVTPEQVRSVEENIEQTAALFPRDVAKILYTFGEDWTGDPSIVFRVLLTDAPRTWDKSPDIMDRIQKQLSINFDSAQSDYLPYFYFRTVEEQEKLQDPKWQ